MRLSTRSRYGTRMMADLAARYEEGPVQIGEIAKRQNISVKYLEQLIIPLKRADFIISVRGPKGGHRLARPPETISVGEIVRVLEGNIALSVCTIDPKSCERSGSCRTRNIWGEAARAMMEKLEETSLAALIGQPEKGPGR